MALEASVAALVLLTALLHAAWNAVIKQSSDRLLSTALIMATGGGIGAALIPFFPLPPSRAVPYLVTSMVLHTVYVSLIVASYERGDLGRIYPISRGLGPLVVAALSSRFAHESPPGIQLVALFTASCGIMSLAWGEGRGSARSRSAVALAITNGITIGCYSFVDGLGVRLAGEAASYIAWQSALAALPLTGFVLLRRRALSSGFLRGEGLRAALAGALAMLGYAIVLWAMQRGSLAMVAALRETSVIFAALIGTLLLGEPFGRRRTLAAALVAAGIALLNLGGASGR